MPEDIFDKFVVGRSTPQTTNMVSVSSTVYEVGGSSLLPARTFKCRAKVVKATVVCCEVSVSRASRDKFEQQPSRKGQFWWFASPHLEIQFAIPRWTGFVPENVE